jgi:hypothetical protein
MEVRCPHCGKVQPFAEEGFGKRDSLSIPCAACGQAFRVINPKTQTLRVEPTRKSVPSITSEYTADGRKLTLPQDKVISLKLLEGEDKGTVYAVAKPRITMGRANADILIDDRMASRLHCALEIMDECVLLRDLGSTNGTLVDDQPITSAPLASGSTFRIGNHVFQLLIGPKEA